MMSQYEAIYQLRAVMKLKIMEKDLKYRNMSDSRKAFAFWHCVGPAVLYCLYILCGARCDIAFVAGMV